MCRSDRPAPPISPRGSTRCSKPIYLIFNEGYAATAGERLIREEISGEAIRLASLPDARTRRQRMPRAWALLALLLLHAARFPARVSSDGELFLLRDQDRSKWDRQLIAEGLRALDRSATGVDVSAITCRPRSPPVMPWRRRGARPTGRALRAATGARSTLTRRRSSTLNRAIAEIAGVSLRRLASPRSRRLPRIRAWRLSPAAGGPGRAVARGWRLGSGPRQDYRARSGARRIGAGAAFPGRQAGVTRTVIIPTDPWSI